MTYNDRILIREKYKNSLDPYVMDWINFFTPIEYNIWCVIRLLGLKFVPQYPIGKYFVDFANIQEKICLEVDGKDWHNDLEKDRARECEIKNRGWKIIRISGKDSYDEETVMEIFKKSGIISYPPLTRLTFKTTKSKIIV